MSVFSSLFSRDPSKDFPYEIIQKNSQKSDYEIFVLNKGKRKGTDEEFSIFTADLKNANQSDAALAKSCAKRLKTLKHPNVLTFVDSLEADAFVQIVTESVTPLSTYLESLSGLSEERRTSLISWGLLQVANAVKFICQDAKLLHNNIRLDTVFVNKCGEWKLFGFEYVTPHQNVSSFPVKPYALEKYNAPECKSGNISVNEPWSADSWALGCFIWEVFNGHLTTGGPTQLKAPKAIPKVLHQPYAKLLAPNAAQRATPEQFIEMCRKPNGFMRNKVVDCLIFLEEFHLKEAREKSTFLSQFQEQLDILPEGVQKYKILPLLINAYEYGNAGSAVLSPLLKIGKLLTEMEYQQQIVPCVVKFFNSPDRATRVKLLQQIESFVEHLQPAIVNEKIYGPLATGFTDTIPAVRESTVKAVIFLAPKLNYNNLNIELMKHFARLQSRDDQAGIRTNTTICLGKIAAYIHPQNRQKILSSAFSRAIKDPFPPSRVAGVLAFSATQQFYPLAEVANRIVPALCSLTVDPEKQVRDQAFKAIKGFVEKLEKASENPELIQEMEAQVNSVSASAAGVGESVPQWASWAFSALSSKFYKTPTTTPSATPTAAGGSTATPTIPPSIGTPSSAPKPSSVAPRTPIERPSPTTEPEYEEENAWEDADNDWGQIDESTTAKQSGKSSAPAASTPSAADGWGAEDEPWEGIEEAFASSTPPKADSRKSSTKSQPIHAIASRETTPQAGQPKSSAFAAAGVSSGGGGWGEDEENGWNEDGGGWGNDAAQAVDSESKKAEERKQKAEERRLELEKKRQAKMTGGPMKLGAKKVNEPPFF